MRVDCRGFGKTLYCEAAIEPFLPESSLLSRGSLVRRSQSRLTGAFSRLGRSVRRCLFRRAEQVFVARASLVLCGFKVPLNVFDDFGPYLASRDTGESRSQIMGGSLKPEVSSYEGSALTLKSSAALRYSAQIISEAIILQKPALSILSIRQDYPFLPS